jgi:hypothetical protein
MRYGLIIAGITIGWTLAGPVRAAATPRENTSKDRLFRQTIQAGIAYLRNAQQADGSWEIYQVAAIYRGGCTSLAVLAMLESGVPARDKQVQKGLSYLRKLQPDFTYVRALQTMVFVRAAQAEDAQRIQANVDWLVKARAKDGDKLLGWTYGSAHKSFPDNSNTRYAVLALHAARLNGAKFPRGVWESIRSYYLRTQTKEGGWVYSEKFGNLSYLTMDVAGLTGLVAAELALKKDLKTILKEKAPARALRRIGDTFKAELPARVYYNLHGIKTLAQLSRVQLLGNHDWYREGCKFLLKAQHKDGSWPKGGQFDQWPLINTSFALIFLAK